MNRQQAQALVIYMQKGVGLIPTTYIEAGMVRDAMASIEAIANGIAIMEVKPIEPPPQIRPGPSGAKPKKTKRTPRSARKESAGEA